MDFVLQVVGEALRDFLLVDSMTSNVFQTMYALILVEIDISKDSLRRLSWIPLLALGFKCLIMRASLSVARNAT